MYRSKEQAMWLIHKAETHVALSIQFLEKAGCQDQAREYAKSARRILKQVIHALDNVI
jgi:hypothetical protein